MELGNFKSQLEAARQIEAVLGGGTYRLRMPTDHAWRVALEAHRDADGRVIESRAFRAILNTALVGWEGVTTADLLPEAEPAPLPYSDEARALLLDNRQDIADALTVHIGMKLRERREAREAARKNSSPASNGS